MHTTGFMSHSSSHFSFSTLLSLSSAYDTPRFTRNRTYTKTCSVFMCPLHRSFLSLFSLLSLSFLCSLSFFVLLSLILSPYQCHNTCASFQPHIHTHVLLCHTDTRSALAFSSFPLPLSAPYTMTSHLQQHKHVAADICPYVFLVSPFHLIHTQHR